MFAHLHVHTEYSLLDGLSKIEPLVRHCADQGMNSLAITDHGALYGVIDFYRAAKAANIKPIIGCEMYVAQGSRLNKEPGDKSQYHLTVLAKNNTGYANLVKLVTAAHLEGFYYKPRADRELLERHSEGLIVLSGCPSGEVPGLLAQGRGDDARAAASWYSETFDDYYLELMQHEGIAELPAINEGLLKLHSELELPVVATNDLHYVSREDASLQDILLCIQTNTSVGDTNRMKMSEDSYYLRSPEEMMALYPDLPEAVTNSQLIADMCDVEIDFSQVHLPEYEPPDGLDSDAYLAKLAREGLKRRFADPGPDEEQRLEEELAVIRETSFANYFLVVWDIARFVRERGIFSAVRGSAAASLVLYCLDATDVDPIEYGLVFERFLNVERKEMPDIDLDLQDDRREEVLNYVVEKYGQDQVAQIISFGTLGAKASIRDTGRALAMPYPDVDRIARLVPNKLGVTLEEALELNPEFQEVYDADQGVRKLVDTARGLEGVTRHASTHAAGVVISDVPMDSFVPLQRPSKGDGDGISMTQFAMEPVAALGLIKMDFLGLSNLTILARAKQLMAETRGEQLDLADIPLDDQKTFDLLSRGDTVGVFQLEGSGMTRTIQELKPSSVMDVAAQIALYRPGPMEQIDTFIEAKHGRAAPQPIHEDLSEILRETYGVIVYQDQVLLIAQRFAGYSLGEADIVRKAMGKKIPAIMAQERDRFLQGASRQGYSAEVAEAVFALVEPFAGYAFNKAHAVSYALISYWTAFLKANYPVEFMVCLLNAHSGNSDKVFAAVEECKRLKIPVLPPSVNHSRTEFAFERQNGSGAVRFGLTTIKNVGDSAVEPIIAARDKSGPFGSLELMCREADLSGLNRKTIESLVRAGALDEFGERGALLGAVDRIRSLALSEASLRDSNQTTMFDLFGESVPTPLVTIELTAEEAGPKLRQEWEIELLGVALAESELDKVIAQNTSPDSVTSRKQIVSGMDGDTVSMVGQVSSVMERHTQNGKPYLITTLKLHNSGEIDVFVFAETRERTWDLWEEGKLLRVEGKVRVRGDRISVTCVNASVITGEDAQPGGVISPTSTMAGDETPRVSTTVVTRPASPPPEGSNGAAKPHTETGPRTLRIVLRESEEPDHDLEVLHQVRELLLDNRGRDEVRLEVTSDGTVVTLDWSIIRVTATEDFARSLRDVVGEQGRVSLETAEA